jgi:hypothetical protein
LFIPARARHKIAIARDMMKYFMFIAHEKLIKKDSISIEMLIAKAIPKSTEVTRSLVFIFSPSHLFFFLSTLGNEL